MPSLKKINARTGSSYRRWSELEDDVKTTVEAKKGGGAEDSAADITALKLSEWEQDYTWEAMEQAIKDGYILKTVPGGWLRVRDIAEDIGGKQAVPWMLGSGERPAQVVWDAGVYDRCRMDEGYELLCSPEDAEILRNHASPKWEALENSRGRNRRN